jgi:hypothetical protein
VKSHHRTGINCRCLRRLRERQFIPSATEDARPSAQASLHLRSRLAARRPTGSLTLRLSLRLNAWTRDWRNQRVASRFFVLSDDLSVEAKMRVNENVYPLAVIRKSFMDSLKRPRRKRSFGKIATMTELERPIKRRSRMPFSHYRKRMVVMLHPGDKIAMRLERSRTWYWAELDDVFRILAQWHAARERQRIREERKARRGS